MNILSDNVVQKTIYYGLPVWATVILTILAIILGLIIGMFVTGFFYRQKNKPKSDVNEKMLRAIGKEIGRNFTPAQINQMLKSIKKGK